VKLGSTEYSQRPEPSEIARLTKSHNQRKQIALGKKKEERRKKGIKSLIKIKGAAPKKKRESG